MRRAGIAFVAFLAIVAASAAALASSTRTPPCPVTIPDRTAPRGAGTTANGFNYGNGKLRVHLGWPRGVLPAGILPNGGSYATVNEDGSIWLKVGWWRGLPHRLVITGRRLDRRAPPLQAGVPDGYGATGFVPAGLVFPTDGCWRVEGRLGPARLVFVVRVEKLAWH